MPGPRGAPLLYAGTRDGINSAVLAFEPRRSDLPLQVAFPILLANLTGELLGSSTGPSEAVDPGTPVELHIPAGAVGLTVIGPDGATTRMAPSSTARGSSTVTFAATDLPGIYTVTPIPDPDASPETSAGAPSSGAASPIASVTPRQTGGAAASPSGSPAVQDPMAPVRFVVDLFDVDESTIAPGSAATIEVLGTTGGAASPQPGASAAPGTPVTERPTTRDELWVPIVLLILTVLCVEWALFHRDGLIRLRRLVGDRLARGTGTGP